MTNFPGETAIPAIPITPDLSNVPQEVLARAAYNVSGASPFSNTAPYGVQPRIVDFETHEIRFPQNPNELNNLGSDEVVTGLDKDGNPADTTLLHDIPISQADLDLAKNQLGDDPLAKINQTYWRKSPYIQEPVVNTIGSDFIPGTRTVSAVNEEGETLRRSELDNSAETKRNKAVERAANREISGGLSGVEGTKKSVELGIAGILEGVKAGNLSEQLALLADLLPDTSDIVELQELNANRHKTPEERERAAELKISLIRSGIINPNPSSRVFEQEFQNNYLPGARTAELRNLINETTHEAIRKQTSIRILAKSSFGSVGVENIEIGIPNYLEYLKTCEQGPNTLMMIAEAERLIEAGYSTDLLKKLYELALVDITAIRKFGVFQEGTPEFEQLLPKRSVDVKTAYAQIRQAKAEWVIEQFKDLMLPQERLNLMDESGIPIYVLMQEFAKQNKKVLPIDLYAKYKDSMKALKDDFIAGTLLNNCTDLVENS